MICQPLAGCDALTVFLMDVLNFCDADERSLHGFKIALEGASQAEFTDDD